MLNVYKEFLETKEPRSNWEMPNIKREEAALAELKAKEAEEAAALEKASKKKGKKAKV